MTGNTLTGWILAIIIVIAVLAITIGPEINKFFREYRILKYGTRSSAVIISVTDTGTRINNNPKVRLQIEVHPENSAPFLADVTEIISIVELYKYQPGKKIQVVYDPANPAAIAITDK